MKAIPINTAAHQNSWKKKTILLLLLSILLFYIQIYNLQLSIVLLYAMYPYWIKDFSIWLMVLLRQRLYTSKIHHNTPKQKKEKKKRKEKENTKLLIG